MAGTLRQRGLVRQWKLLRALQAARLGLTWGELIEAADERVHKRTIYRDIDTLTFAGFPIDVESKQGGESTRIVLRERVLH